MSTRPNTSAARLSRLVLVGALGSFAGCDFGSGDSQFAPGNECVDNSDCVQGTCFGDFCAIVTGQQSGVVIEVLRGPSDAELVVPASWAFLPDAYSAGDVRDLVLPPTRQVVGVIRWKGTRVPATIRFDRRMAEPLAALPAMTVSVDTFLEASLSNQPEDVDYNAVLVAGQTYDVAVLPTADVIGTDGTDVPALRTLPPFYTQLQVDGAGDATSLRFDVSFPDDLDQECGEEEFVGCTLTGRMLSSDGETLSPAAGLQVRAVDKEFGRVVSSVATTDEMGNYAIRVASDAGAYVIRATSPSGSNEPFPSVSIDPELAFVDTPLERSVFIPRVEPTVFNGLVRGNDLVPVQGATISFSSANIFDESQLGLEGSFEASATTGDDGSFNVSLLPGVYDIVVTPPDDSTNGWAPAATRATILEGVTGVDVVLPPQVLFAGSCATFAGDPASGVTILARPRGGPDVLQRSRETVSTETGEYWMTLDAGFYDVLVKVADSTGFPWLIEPGIPVGAQNVPTNLTFQLPPPIVVQGVLRSANGAPVGEAPIRAHIFENGDGLRPLQIAETTSEEDGSYQLLIAPRLAGR